MKITFDWNCLIEVQDQRPQARDVLQLVEMHRKGEVEVAMLAASASENNASRQLPGSSAVFEKRRQELGWEDLPLVPMVKVWGLSYWGFSS